MQITLVREHFELHRANETNCAKHATAGPASVHFSAVTLRATRLLDEVYIPLGSDFTFGDDIGFVVGAAK